jgi:hypothetical protein
VEEDLLHRRLIDPIHHHPKIPSVEDMDIMVRLRQGGRSRAATPEMVIMHHHRKVLSVEENLDIVIIMVRLRQGGSQAAIMHHHPKIPSVEENLEHIIMVHPHPTIIHNNIAVDHPQRDLLLLHVVLERRRHNVMFRRSIHLNMDMQ